MDQKSKYNFVQQRTDWDCVYAVIAIWTGNTLDDVLETAKILNVPLSACSDIDEAKILKHYGKQVLRLETAYSGVPGILSFPSLNFPGKGHAVFYDGRNIYDPQTGRDFKSSYETLVDGPCTGGYWPGCYNISVDIKDSYSREMADMEINNKLRILNKEKAKNVEKTQKEIRA